MRSLFFILCLLTLILSACSKAEPTYYQGYIEGDVRYIASPISGELVTLDVKRGDFVKAKQRLFQLDPEPQLTRLHQAKANVQKAELTVENLTKGLRPSEIENIQAKILQTKARLKLEAANLKRYAQLYKKRAASKEQFDKQQSLYDEQTARLAQLEAELVTGRLGAREDEINVAKAELARAQHALAQTQWNLDQKTVSAPIAGQIVETFYAKGEQVLTRQAVLSLLAPEDKHVIFFVPEKFLSTLKLDEPMHVSCDHCEKTYVAKISYISPEAEYTPPVIYSRESRHKLVYRVRASLEGKAALALHAGQPIEIAKAGE